MSILTLLLRVCCLLAVSTLVSAQVPAPSLGTSAGVNGVIAGTVRDETGAPLPGVTVEWRSSDRSGTAVTASDGRYQLTNVPPGSVSISYTLVNFATVRRTDRRQRTSLDVVMHLAFGANVVVTGTRTFTNLADVENPAENLSGVAQSASQGAITARQLEARPIMRAGEVLETVPGVIVSQHSGEGKANQYYLRGFNLDHGTDFATSVAGMPVNMPTHAHGQGYADLNFLIPELVGGVQFSKGPYFAEQGDFGTAGAAQIHYVNVLEHPIAHISGGAQNFGRALFAAAPKAGSGTFLTAVALEHSDGPWRRPDDFQKLNALARYSSGGAAGGFSLTALAYHASWNSTDQIPDRALAAQRLGRFDAIDPTDGGNTSRYSGSFEWQRAGGNRSTRVSAYGIAYGLDLFSNFTYFLDDPVHGDQFRQSDRRFISGGAVTQTRIGRTFGKSMQNTAGLQLRHDAIGTVGLYHTEDRAPLDTIREDSVQETSAAAYAQNETYWTPTLRTIAGLRADMYRFAVAEKHGGSIAPARYAGLLSPKGGVIAGPFGGVEFYGNAGLGFHSNDARAVVVREDDASAGEGVTPLARGRGAETGVRVVSIPHLQTTLAFWGLWLDSELVFAGDAGTTEAARPSRRRGFEWANYYVPVRWLTLDADVSWSRARFTDDDPAGAFVPGAVRTVVAMGAVADYQRVVGSVRWRYFGPRPLIEDNSVQSDATSLVNLQAAYRLTRRWTATVDVFNLTDARDSDVDYFYTSRLPNEPADGVDDVHSHPVLPRTVRAMLSVSF
jgi:outer membrane receptor protein involved in Fe transport